MRDPLPDPSSYIASFEEIRSGRVTDIYFHRAVQILKAKNIHRHVVAEFIAKKFPNNWPWAILSGLGECLAQLEGKKVSARAMPEGTLFRPFEPVLILEGDYTEFGAEETPLLGYLCQGSGIATKAARLKRLAGERTIIHFGARRMHPALAPSIDRHAYVGGCDAISTILSAELLGIEPTGTMPHALILVLGDTVEAARAFHQIIEPQVPRVVLIDTFNDEKFEALNVAEALGGTLFGLRFDTPGSRRGNMYQILEETRWELDLRGFSEVKLMVSGGIDEEDVVRLNPLVDAYGIGTAISSGQTIDLSMDIVAVQGQPVAKRGKWSGDKEVYRCTETGSDLVLPRGVTPQSRGYAGSYQPLLFPILENGKPLYKPLPPSEIRAYVLDQLAALSDADNP